LRPTRKKRLDEQIREVLGEILLTRAGDPRLALVTLTSVRISPELDTARVFFSVLGDEARRDEALDALRRAAPFLRKELAREVRLRRTPELRFVFDESTARGLRMDGVLRDIARERARREPSSDEAAGSRPEADHDA